jgi:hypothetical protein
MRGVLGKGRARRRRRGGEEEEEEEEEEAAAEAEEGLVRDEHLAAAATAIRCRSADGKPCLGE